MLANKICKKMVKKINIGFFGDGPWALKALAQLMPSDRYAVVFFVKRFNSVDPEIEKLLSQHDIQIYNIKDVNCDGSINLFMSHKPDIFVSMSFDQIMKEKIINATKFGFLNCHAGLLPFYRGRNTLNWALINGEDAFGISVHVIDEGVDTGPLVLQEMFPISESDDYSTLLDLAHRSCPRVLMRGLDKYIAEPRNVTPQSEISDKHSYFPKRIKGDEWINWNLKSNQIHNFVRGIAFPGPGARTILAGQQIIVCNTKIYYSGALNGGMTGQIVGRDNGGILVKCGEGIISIGSYATMEKDGSFSEIKPPDFKLGAFLGFKQDYEMYLLNQKNIELTQKIENLTKTIEIMKSGSYEE